MDTEASSTPKWSGEPIDIETGGWRHGDHPAPPCVASRPHAAAVRPNTVKLGRDRGVAGLLLGLWPPGVVGAFDVPLGHLAFDDAWRGASSSCRVEAGDQSAQEGQP